MVSMMPPSVLLEVFEEFALEPPRSAIELSIKEEMIDCADSPLVEDEADAALEELEELPVSALIRL
jgi:hypothetical protein